MDLHGESVAAFRRRIGTAFTSDIAFDILRQMLRSIANIHAAGLVHRDIKEVRGARITVQANFVMGRPEMN